MDTKLTILNSAALVAEISEYSGEALEYSEEAELEDEMPVTVKIIIKEKMNAHK